jgi:hypothetical protein
MHPDTREVAEHMKEFGLHVLGRAIYDATFNETMRPFAHALSITHAAHATEILLKAKVAEEHPLLIFSRLPKPSTTDRELTVSELFEYGQSCNYHELPDLLWATTGIRIDRLQEFLEFGKLRNKIIHFAVPNIELADETLKFVINVLDPLIEKFWGLSGIPYSVEWDDAIISDGYLGERLIRIGIHIDERLRRIMGSDSASNAQKLFDFYNSAYPDS